MRYALLVISLWLLGGAARAAGVPADTAALRISSLPPAGLRLQKGWRYHAGDDPAWAKPDFDDRHWDTVTVGRPGRLPSPRVLGGCGWFRLRIRLADSVRYQALKLSMSRAMAGYEVYADGRLLGRYGTFSANPARVRPGGLAPPSLALVPASAWPELVLAVRFAPWYPGPPLGALLAQNPSRDLPLQLQQRTESDHFAKQVDFFFALLSGMFLLLGLLHAAFFHYNPSQRANVYFAVYALVSFANNADLIIDNSALSLGAGLAYSGLVVILQNLALLAGLRALYALFGVRPGRLYAALWLGAALLVVWSVYRGVVNSSPNPLLFILGFTFVTLAQLRLVWRAMRQRRRGSGLIGGGFGLGLLLVLVALGLALCFPQVAQSSAGLGLVAISLYLGFIAPPLSISLYLAREFALDAKLLQIKLVEVEALSAQTLAQEQEKQALLESQKETLETQVHQRTGELQRSLTDLRATQQQLIQKEKMASLGELTAGIAHEIQNPLNFVNNFSEVSAELVAELQEAQAVGDTAEVTALADDLRQNLGKISQHGQRAARIVQGMLEHSRQSTGERTLTDINALADEYLRLAYHGLRAKDKAFNAELKTDFAPGLPRAEAVGQDLGRVLLNLFNNAFYAVQQRQQASEASYVPTVSVRTRQLASQVEIRVSDNGTGISEAVQQKIFQPFFTTKPTGEGTGLGLSLSHDIIVQGHGGTLTVASQPGQGTTFSISLPA